jgi:DnaK suppressor protein
MATSAYAGLIRPSSLARGDRSTLGCRGRRRSAQRYDPRVQPTDHVAASHVAASRVALETERARLAAELADTEVLAPGQITYGSQAAAATHVFEQQRDLALRDHNRQLLTAVEEAIARLDAGTYGTCTSCGNPIAVERLEALPWAALCIDCQRSARR